MRAAEHFRHAKVRNLELAILGQEQVLKLNIAVRYAILMQIIHPLDELLEETQAVFLLVLIFEVPLGDEAE